MYDPFLLTYHQNLTSDNELLLWTSMGVVHVKEELGHRLPGQYSGGQDDVALATGYTKLVYFCLLILVIISLLYCEAH